jgi:hypothetical protein
MADEPIAEDWGWYVPIEVDGAALALCCGHQYGDDDEFLVSRTHKNPLPASSSRRSM